MLHRGHCKVIGLAFPNWKMRFVEEREGKAIKLLGLQNEYIIRFTKNQFECVVEDLVYDPKVDSDAFVEHIVGRSNNLTDLIDKIKDAENPDESVICHRCGERFVDYCERCERIAWERRECGGGYDRDPREDELF